MRCALRARSGLRLRGHVGAHIRRLEALRRAGIVKRIDPDQWRIPDDFESRAAAYDAGRSRQSRSASYRFSTLKADRRRRAT
ncbi:DUF3363 domain-containing protein [Phyllobacterium phragmitis]|uniref:DUF3363 domain-containing protein n=1 Tax=Phyllobacterium phragmitis TaxID=2670329 RepID=UPI003CC98178